MFDVVTVGTATRDLFVQSRFFRVVRDRQHLEKLGFARGEAECLALGAKIEVPRPVATVGGGAANTAATFARFGFKTACLAKVGADRDGAAVADDLVRERITPFLVRDKEEGTASSIILLSPSGERTILNYRGASSDLRRDDIPFSRLTARWVHIVPGRIPYPVMLSFITHFRKRGARISLNPSQGYLTVGARRLKPLLDHVDAVFVNREEACLLTGMHWENERGMFKKFDELVRGLAVVTDGARGVLVSNGARLFRAGVYREKKCVDRTGAGDAFASGFVAGLLQVSGFPPPLKLWRAGKCRVSEKEKTAFSDKAIKHAIRAGSANATSVVEHIGAQAGILTARQFAMQSRWRTLPISEHRITT